ncbi:MAG: hypothetical protein HY711_08095 [Candidatus Melainabacteria bacterium]|nr:hypothetical protein [Candidatus Melainabacteria bacterium]
MKSYIVCGLDNSDKGLLHNHGVVFYDWNTDIIIDQTQLEPTLSILNATATEAPTEYEDLYKLTLQFNAKAESTGDKNRVLDRAHAQSRASYIQACSYRLKGLENEAQAKVSDGRQKLVSAQESFVWLARQHHLSGTRVQEDKLRQTFAEQFQRLINVPKVRAIRVSNGSILVYTDMLYARNPGTGLLHELGQYLIVIRTDGSDDALRWFNRTRRIRTIQPGMNAPRVFADGTACVDEIKETLLELIAQFEFATVVELAIQFVETITNDELSKHIEKWPVIQEKTA